MEFNAYVIKASSKKGHRRLTVLGNEGGAVRFAADRRDAREWEMRKGCWSRPATKGERVALLINVDGAELHRIRHTQWAAHRLWEKSHDIINSLRLVGAYCATWPIIDGLSVDKLVEKINDVKPWAWSDPSGFSGATNLAAAIALLNGEIARYKGMSDEQASDEEDGLIRDDLDWVYINNRTWIADGHSNERAERGMWESRLRRRLLRAVRAA